MRKIATGVAIGVLMAAGGAVLVYVAIERDEADRTQAARDFAAKRVRDAIIHEAATHRETICLCVSRDCATRAYTAMAFWRDSVRDKLPRLGLQERQAVYALLSEGTACYQVAIH